MRAPWAALAVALVAVCVGCSTSGTTRSRLDAIRQGMTAQQVRDTLGPPLMIDCQGGRARTEMWRYNEGVVILDRERVTYRLAVAPSGT